MIGTRQAAAYRGITGRVLKAITIPLIFSFGYEERASRGTIEVSIPIPDGQNVANPVHVVEADIPVLIGK